MGMRVVFVRIRGRLMGQVFEVIRVSPQDILLLGLLLLLILRLGRCIGDSLPELGNDF
jgi:hypothetical protein